MNNILYNIYPILAEIYIIFSVNILLIYGVFFSTSSKIGYPLLNANLAWLVFQITFFSVILLFFQSSLNFIFWNDFLISNSFIYGLKFIVLISFIFFFFLTFFYSLHEKINSFEYWILLLLAIVASLFIIQSYDLLTIYISIELQSLIFYVLATFKRTSEFSTEAGLKYFILGAFSSALLLFGSSLLYALTGLTNLGDFQKLFTELTLSETSLLFGNWIGLIFIITALLFKLSSAPFHMWAPDVYEGSPTSIMAFFSIIPKLVIITLLIRFLIFTFQDFIFLWKNIILSCALLSIFIGTFGAFSQIKWKRFLAYSSISHVGFFLLALLNLDFEGISSIVFYAIIYILMTLGLFSFILNLRFYSYPSHYQTRYLQDLFSFARINPILSLSLSLILFSMAGIPPLAGFFSKLFILLSALQKNMFGSTIFVILMSCIGCFYYIRLIKTMYFNFTELWIISYPVNKLTSYVLGLSTLSILFLFLDIEILSLFTTWMSLVFLQ